MEKNTILKNITELQVLSSQDFIHDEWKINKIEVQPPFKSPSKTCIGIDPGTVNLGVSILSNGKALTYRIRFLRDKNPVVRMVNTKKILSFLITERMENIRVCIEGASYGDVYRQVELAEIRAACIWWAMDQKMIPIIAQPTEIRKGVFGNGTIKAKEIWKNQLSGDAADALACAYFAGL